MHQKFLGRLLRFLSPTLSGSDCRERSVVIRGKFSPKMRALHSAAADALSLQCGLKFRNSWDRRFLISLILIRPCNTFNRPGPVGKHIDSIKCTWTCEPVVRRITHSYEAEVVGQFTASPTSRQLTRSFAVQTPEAPPQSRHCSAYCKLTFKISSFSVFIRAGLSENMQLSMRTSQCP